MYITDTHKKTDLKNTKSLPILGLRALGVNLIP